MNRHTFVDPDDSSSSGCAHVEGGQRCRRVKLSDAHSYDPAPPPAKPTENRPMLRPHVYYPDPEQGHRGPCITALADGHPCGMQRISPVHISPLGLAPRARPHQLTAKHTVETRFPGMSLPLGALIDVVEAAMEQGAPLDTEVHWHHGGGGQRDDEPAYVQIRLTWEA